jgi:transcriptional regulator with XRE-family HTH domain
MPLTPHHVDLHVGRRLKLRRVILGLSQERLGELLGLTFQQIQKYERGANRLGASRLYEAARALRVDIGFFFEELVDGAEVETEGLAETAVEARGATPCGPRGGRRDTLELVRAFERIEDPELRRRVLDIAEAVAAAEFRSGRGA